MRRFIIRDIETRKLIIINKMTLDFNSFVAAKMYLRSLQFGLGNYYEIYDTEDDQVVFKYVMDINGHKKNGKLRVVSSL